MELWHKNFEYYRKEPFRVGEKISIMVIGASFTVAILVIAFSYIQFSDELEALNKDLDIFTEAEKPAPVYSKGIYLTNWTAGGKRMTELLKVINETELNTVVIDIKDYTGKVGFDSSVPLVRELELQEIRMNDFPALIKRLHENDVYIIARISVFQDPELAKKRPDLAIKNKYTGRVWTDNSGLGWMDPSSREVWKYAVSLAKEAARLGVDEINFDYVRFPSDGTLSAMSYPFWDEQTSKHEVMRSFFRYLDFQMKRFPVYLSADFFGLTLVRGGDDDLGIGQRLEDALPYFDYIMPMTYPSHYQSGFEGISNPAAHPYEVISKSIEYAKKNHGDEVVSKLRIWLQDFDVGAEYTASMIRKEKQAVYDSGAYGWVMWNSRNQYTIDAFDAN